MESRPEVGGATYMPVVYKMPMVRMLLNTTDVNSECTSLNRDTLEMAWLSIDSVCGVK